MLRARRPIAALAVAALMGCGGGAEVGRAPLTVYAAASLSDLAPELAAAFTRREATEVVLNLAGSNTLAQQIAAAPRADVFLSADERWVDVLAAGGHVEPGSRRPFLANRLVVVAHRDAALELASLADLARPEVRRLALADPVAVPAGRYARAYLERQPAAGGGDLWRALAERVVPALDVRAALALVEADPQIVGIVYRTDAARSGRVRVLAELPPVAGVDVRYWAVRVAGGPNPEAGRRFLAFLDHPEARAAALRHGFLPAGDG